MSNEMNVSLAKSTRRPPVRVKLQRITASSARPYPPDGLRKDWWERLRKALGTKSSDFVLSSLVQLQSAARLPCTGISETAVNAALAYIEAVAPEDEVQAALAVQMACTHTAAMNLLARLAPGHWTERHVVAMATAASRLLRAHTQQVEVLHRLRRGPDQIIRIERVDVHDGGQAIWEGLRPAPNDAPKRKPFPTTAYPSLCGPGNGRGGTPYLAGNMGSMGERGPPSLSFTRLSIFCPAVALGRC